MAAFVCNMRKYLTENYPFLEKIPPTIFLQLQSFYCYYDSFETIMYDAMNRDTQSLAMFNDTYPVIRKSFANFITIFFA